MLQEGTDKKLTTSEQFFRVRNIQYRSGSSKLYVNLKTRILILSSDF